MKHVLGLSILVVFVGCGGSSDDDMNGTNQPVPIDDVPALYAEASCAVSRACWGEILPVLLAGEDCEANAETAISDELARLKQSIEDGKIAYDGSKIRACLAAIRARGCVESGEPAECTAAVDGTVEIGDECSANSQCKGADTYCKTASACPGQCARRESASSACQRDNDCAAGLRCSEDTQRCIEPAADGEECEGGSAPECEAGLICIGANDDAAQTGTCRTISEGFSVGAGGACLIGGAAFCRPDLRCSVESFDPVTQMATARCTEPVASGAACKLSYPDVCPFSQYCAVPPGSLDGTCTAKPGAGQPCAARGDDPAEICAPGARCDGATCRPLQKLEGACQEDDTCYSNTCEAGGCVSAGGC